MAVLAAASIAAQATISGTREKRRAVLRHMEKWF
jgi:hypothetical protein